MNTLIEKMTGMDVMTDEMIANDLLIASKTGVRNYAYAITETTSPEVREILRTQLDDAITMHQRISQYMLAKGYYQAHDPRAQIQTDIKNADMVLKL